jgi:hypothetical protein
MGIKTSAGGSAEFFKINAKEGCLQQRKDGVTTKFEPGRTTLTGMLVGLRIDKDEFEGQQNESIRFIFKDTDTDGAPNMHVSMTIVSGDTPSAFAIKALAKVNAADVSKPISLAPYLITKGTKLGEITYDKDVAGITVKQDGVKLTEDLGTPDNKLPERPSIMGASGKPVIVQGKEVKDSSAWGELLDLQLERLFAKFGPAEGQAKEEGINAGEVAAGAEAANRSEMRHRA